jgi:hypothetical protein
MGNTRLLVKKQENATYGTVNPSFTMKYISRTFNVSTVFDSTLEMENYALTGAHHHGI